MTAAQEVVDYEELVESFGQALITKLRQHSIADSFLDFWVPDSDPVLGVAGMAESACIAGLDSVAIRFRLSTLPADRLGELEKVTSEFATVMLDRAADVVTLTASGMRQRAAAQRRECTDGGRVGSSPASSPSEAPGPTHRGAASTVPGTGDTRIDGEERSEAHEHFRAALRQASTSSRPAVAPADAADGLVLRAEADGIALVLQVERDSGIVLAAHHEGTTLPYEKGALNVFCALAEGLPSQEVADHVGLNVIGSLVDEDSAVPVPGILLPANAGTVFAIAPGLARDILNQYLTAKRREPEVNFYYATPSPEWQALGAPQRVQAVDVKLRGFLQSDGLYPDDMILLRVERNRNGYHVRCVLDFSDRIAVGDKPRLLRALERTLRRDVEAQLEVLAAKAQDTSPLRRLTS